MEHGETPNRLWIGSRLLLLLAFAAGSSLATLRATPADDLKLLEQKLGRAIQSQDVSVAEAAIDGLAEVASERAIELIVVAMLKIQSSEVFDYGVAALVKLGSEKLSPKFESAFTDRKASAEELGVVMVVAAKLPDERSEGWLVTGLRHESGLVARLAIDGARERHSKGAIPILIELLEERGVDKDSIAYEARQALIFLTRRNFDSGEDWRKFWDSHRDGFDPKNPGEGDGQTGVVLLDPDAPEFFGVKIVSDKVAFVIDISGSMVQFDPGGGGGSWESRQRITRTKYQLAKAIQELSKGSYFNVIAFNEEIDLFQKQLVPANSGQKKKALGFVNNLIADRGTDTGLALEAAFQDPRVDTIVLLSDGSPHTPAGKPEVLMPLVEQQLTDLNRLRKVRVYTFGFSGQGEWPPGSKYKNYPMPEPGELEAFLKRLAEKNRGTYTRID